MLCAVLSMAQAPQLFNYQSVVRNASGNPVANGLVNLKFTIHLNSASGTVVYQETQADSTNQFGLVTAQIGNGIVSQGTFAGINWANGLVYLQVQLSINGGPYADMGAAQLLSVPYALYSQSTATSASTWKDYGIFTETNYSGQPPFTVLIDSGWANRALNTTESSAGANISRIADSVLLQPGTYHINATAYCSFINVWGALHTQLRLRDLTDQNTLLVGLAPLYSAAPSDNQEVITIPTALEGTFVVSSAVHVALQQYVTLYPHLATFGAGAPVNSGENEVYTRLLIQKID